MRGHTFVWSLQSTSGEFYARCSSNQAVVADARQDLVSAIEHWLRTVDLGVSSRESKAHRTDARDRLVLS